MSKGTWISYSPAELAWIEAHCTMPRRDAHALFCATFRRADVTVNNYHALCKRKGWLTGRDGRIKAGDVSWNKGKKMPSNANSARTQFKKGHLPHNTKFAGHERVSKDGYVEISVEDTNPYTGFERRYVLKHRWLWEQVNGPVPEGHALKCLDGNRLNIDPANWKPIPRAMLPLLNGRWSIDYDEAEPEMKPAVMAIAEIKHRARTAIKERKHG